MHYVYIIECEDGSYYTGYSTNPERRFKQHLSGKGAKYTRSHKPKELVYVDECPDKSTALRKEHFLKQLSHSEKEEFIFMEQMKTMRWTDGVFVQYFTGATPVADYPMS